jgi:hypothetical protein
MLRIYHYYYCDFINFYLQCFRIALRNIWQGLKSRYLTLEIHRYLELLGERE